MMSEKFKVTRTHRYGDGREVVTEAMLKQSFEEVKGQLLIALSLDTPERSEESDFFVYTSDRSDLCVQSRGNTGETAGGGNISVLLRDYGSGITRLTMAPNHNIWDSNRMQLENLASTLRMALDN